MENLPNSTPNQQVKKSPELVAIVAITVMILVLVSLLFAAMFFALRNQSPEPEPTNEPTPTIDYSDQQYPPADMSAEQFNALENPVIDDSVTITNEGFTPAEITIKADSRLAWLNQDSVVHQLTISGTTNDIFPGSSVPIYFAITGNYEYSVSGFPELTGRVIVQP